MMRYLIITALIFCTATLYGQAKHLDCVPYFDSTLSRTIYTLVDSMPQFPGGTDSLFAFTRNNMKWR